MKEGSVVYLRIWSVYCRSTGWPLSRAKVEFNSWESRGRVTENRMEERATKPSLEGVILPRSRFAFLRVQVSHKTAVGGRRSPVEYEKTGTEGLRKSRLKLTALVRRCARNHAFPICPGLRTPAPRRLPVILS